MVDIVCKRIFWCCNICDDGGIIVVQCMNSGNMRCNIYDGGCEVELAIVDSVCNG